MTFELTQEAYFCLEQGTPEFQVYQAIPEYGISYNKLINKLGIVGKNGYKICLENEWVKFDKTNYKIYKNREIVKDEVCEYIQDIQTGFIPADKKIIKILKDRHYIVEV